MTVRDWWEGLLGRVRSQGAELPLVGALDFRSPLRATHNANTDSIEVRVDPTLLEEIRSGLKVKIGTYDLARDALTNGSIEEGDSVVVSSRSTPGDGGDGDWTCVAIGSHVDNDGTILTGGSLALIRKIQGAVNLSWFGARGDSDGTPGNGTDDTAAVHAAFDFCHATGRKLFVPVTSGSYRVTTGWTTSLPYKGLIVEGERGEYGAIGTSITSRFTLDSTDPDSFFIKYDHLGKYRLDRLSFTCAQYVLDREFIKHTFSGVYGWSFYEDLYFSSVEKPFANKDGMYSQNMVMRNITFANSGSIHSDGLTLKITGLVLDNIYRSGAVPVNSEKCYMDLRGCRMIDGGTIIFDGSPAPTAAQIVSTLVASGTTPPVVTLTGTLTQPRVDLSIAITDTSNPEAVEWSYVLSGLTAWSRSATAVAGTPFDATSGATISNLGGSGVNVVFPAGTYNVNNRYSATHDGWTALRAGDSYASYIRESLGHVRKLWVEIAGILNAVDSINYLEIGWGGSTPPVGARVSVNELGVTKFRYMSTDSANIADLVRLEDTRCGAIFDGLTTRQGFGVTKLPGSTNPKHAKIIVRDAILQGLGDSSGELSGDCITSFDGSSVIWEFDGGLPDGDVATWSGIDGTPTPTAHTDATYGRKIIVNQSSTPANTRGRFSFKARNSATEGHQYNLNIKGKMLEFSSGFGFIYSIQNGTNRGALIQLFSNEEFEVSVPVSIRAGVTTFGFDIAMSGASGISGQIEIYALSVTLGNTVPRRKYPNYKKNVITYASAAPTTGTWAQGDVVYNTAPAAGGAIGWVCVSAGSPGTWVSLGHLPRTGNTTVDVPEIADQTSYTSDAVTVTGAALGDRVQVTCSLNLQGLVLTGYVSAANAVRFVLSNQTGSAVDLAGATYRFWVTPQ